MIPFTVSNAARARGGRRGGLSRAKGYQERRKHRRQLLVAYGVRPLGADDVGYNAETYTNVAREHAQPRPCIKCDYAPKDWPDANRHYKKCIGARSILHKISTLRPGDTE